MNDYLALVLGIACAGAGGELFVRGAVGLGHWARISPGIIGLGTILGSNIFNGLFIVAVAAVICPISVRWQEVAVALGCGLLALVFCYPTRAGLTKRYRGFVLLALYAVYLALIIQRHAPG